MLTSDTSEKSSFHFRYYVRCPYNNSSERYETIDFFFTDIPHNFYFTKIFNRNHELVFFGLFLLNHTRVYLAR